MSDLNLDLAADLENRVYNLDPELRFTVWADLIRQIDNEEWDEDFLTQTFRDLVFERDRLLTAGIEAPSEPFTVEKRDGDLWVISPFFDVGNNVRTRLGFNRRMTYRTFNIHDRASFVCIVSASDFPSINFSILFHVAAIGAPAANKMGLITDSWLRNVRNSAAFVVSSSQRRNEGRPRPESVRFFRVDTSRTVKEALKQEVDSSRSFGWLFNYKIRDDPAIRIHRAAFKARIDRLPSILWLRADRRVNNYILIGPRFIVRDSKSFFRKWACVIVTASFVPTENEPLALPHLDVENFCGGGCIPAKIHLEVP